MAVDTTPPRAAARPTTPAAVLAALTLEEKVAFLHQRMPAVGRLGLAAFVTGTEALHGVAWLGEATSFAQPVGMACSWDPRLLARVGRAVGTEVRAKRVVDARAGLNVWAPVVNVLRHPLWGRTEEGYSEDPDLTGVLATGYCAGLRGDHPDVWLTVPTLKHFLAYGNEVDRSATSSHLPPQTLHEHELTAFRPAVAAGVVGAVMPSYNQVNGRPNHVAGELLDMLRSWAPGSVAVVSDAQAPSSIVDVERYHPDHVTAHAAALRAGVDSFTENADDAGPTIERFTAALAAGLVTEADVDRAVLRLLELRARTGELTDHDPYGVPADALGAPAHRTLAREVAQRGVVVLADAGAALPLNDPRVIAVVGPLAEVTLRDWYSGTLPYGVSFADGIVERYPEAEVRVVDGLDRVALRDVSTGRYLAVDPDDAAVTAHALHPTSTFALSEWGGDVVTLRSDEVGSFVGAGGSFVRAAAAEVDGWVVHELLVMRRYEDGTAAFRHRASGGWLRVQHHTGVLVADGEEDSATRFDVEVLRDGAAEVTAACAGADVVLVAVGNDPHVLGRETEDRKDLDLPPCGRRAFEAAAAVREPVLVVISSYPYAIADEAARSAAVVWSSHAGQELGHGLVDVLSGDVEPSGRLAQTWWRHLDDAGDLLDYDVVGTGQTYRYAAAEPLYPFGHGLSYTHVRYEGVDLTSSHVVAPAVTGTHTPAHTPLLEGVPLPATTPADDGGSGPTARITVTNAGERPVDELVALYASAPRDLAVPAPRRRLVGWTRVHLRPGERRVVELRVLLGTLAVWDVAARDGAGGFVVQPGAYRLMAGAHAGDDAAAAVLTVTGPAAPARDGGDVDASTFHARSAVVTSDRSRESGWCVEVARDADAGWVRYDRVRVASPVREVRLSVTHRSWPSPVPARVRVEARASATATAAAGAWTPLTDEHDVPAGAGHDWSDLVVPATGPSVAAGVLDLRVTLTGAARLATLALR